MLGSCCTVGLAVTLRGEGGGGSSAAPPVQGLLCKLKGARKPAERLWGAKVKLNFPSCL